MIAGNFFTDNSVVFKTKNNDLILTNELKFESSDDDDEFDVYDKSIENHQSVVNCDQSYKGELNNSKFVLIESANSELS